MFIHVSTHVPSKVFNRSRSRSRTDMLGVGVGVVTALALLLPGTARAATVARL